MSLTQELLVLFGKNVTRDPHGINARLHFFGSIPVDDGSPIPDQTPSANEHSQRMPSAAPRPQVVALVSINGGVGRSTLATALSSGLQRLGEAVVALDLDPQNALHHHFGVSSTAPGIGRASLQNAQWGEIQQSGFAGCRMIPFGETDARQQESLGRWLRREPGWLAEHLAGLGLSARHTVIIDTPAGNNVYLRQALSVADVVLVVAQADAACLATLDQLDGLFAAQLNRELPPRCHFVLNQFDEHSAFSLDMFEAFKQRLGQAPSLVRHDTAVSEALASGTDPLDSQAGVTTDINALCRALELPRTLP